MGNFASSGFALCARDDVIDTCSKVDRQKVRFDTTPAAAVSTPRRVIDSLKFIISSFCDSTVTSLSGSSVVLSELDEAWYLDLLGEVDAMRVRCRHSAASLDALDCESTSTTIFLGPSDTTVASINAHTFSTYTAKSWGKSASNEDDDASSCTTEETDDESKCDYSDSDVSDCEASEYGDDQDDHEATSCCCSATSIEEVEYYKEDDDTETKADRLLRLASMSSCNDDAPVYVDDYLCPCGECPQYERIACDVQATVTWRGVKEQASIIRVLQAFSTYNEVIGYHPDMIEAAEECLQLWLGDEDRALNSFVMLYDEVPQLCAGHM